MAAVIVDLDIDEGDTFVMMVEFWSDVDNTLAIDIREDTFQGSFQFGKVNIPMVCTISPYATNVLEASVAYTLMIDLPSKGKYDIDQTIPSNERYRLIQGNVRVNQEVTV